MQITLGLHKEQKDEGTQVRDLVELTEGSVREINSSKGFDNMKSQTSKSTKHG